MDVALVPQNHLDRIPEEVLLEIIKQPCLSDRDLISLARTNRRHYRVAISPAYKAHIEQSHGLAIYWAIENERFETLDRLTENGADVNMLRESGLATVGTRFHSASALERTKAHLEVLRDRRRGWFAPLAWAASLGRNSMVEYLLDHGANIEMKSEYLCDCSDELLYCEDSGELHIPLICEGVSPSGTQWSPLHYAICNKYPMTAQLLLERGANAFDLSGHDTVTALHDATRFKMNETINYLMQHNLVDFNAQNRCGVTALHLAHLSERYDLVDRYLDTGADIDLEYQARSGPWTIFSMACVDDLWDRALQYLHRGADPHFVLDSGLYPEDPYTVMRLIYRDVPNDPDLHAPGDLDRRIGFEQAVIAAGRDRPTNF